MTSIVLDASVAAKWLLPSAAEPLADEAFELLRRYVRAEIRFLVPDIFWPETANLLWKAARLGRCTKKAARQSLLAHQPILPEVKPNCRRTAPGDIGYALLCGKIA